MANKAKIVSSAQKYLQRGAYDKAIRELEKLVEEDPRDVRTLLKIGDIYGKKGDREQAIAVYRRVAEAYAEQGFFQKAVAVYKQIRKHDPQHLEVTIKLAELYEHLGLTQEALAQYQVVASLYDQSGNKNAWLNSLDRMIELDPDNVSSRVRLAEALSREGLAARAIEQFSRAVELLKRQGRQADWVKVAERLVFHDPQRLDVLKELARHYLSEGDHKRALAKLQVVFKATPRDIETVRLLGQGFLAGGYQGKAVYVFQELIRIYQEKGASHEARATAQAILQIDPNDPEALRIVGLAPAPQPSAVTNRQTTASTATLLAPHKGNLTLNSGDLRGVAAEGGVPLHTAEFRTVKAQQEAAAMAGDTAQLPTLTNPVRSGAAPEAPARTSRGPKDEVGKLLSETEVYLKYGLKDRALEHLGKITTLDPECVEARLKLRELYLESGDHGPAAEALGWIIRIYEQRGEKANAEAAWRQLAMLAPHHQSAAKKVMKTARASLSAPDATPQLVHDSIDIDLSQTDGGFETLDPLARRANGAVPEVEIELSNSGISDVDIEHEINDIEVSTSGFSEVEVHNEISNFDVAENDIVDSADLPAADTTDFEYSPPADMGAEPLNDGFAMSEGEARAVARATVPPAPPGTPMELVAIEGLSDQALVELTGEENVPVSVDVPAESPFNAEPAPTFAPKDAGQPIAASLVTAEVAADHAIGNGFDEPLTSDEVPEDAQHGAGELFGDAELMSILGEEDPLAAGAETEEEEENPDVDVELESAEFLEAQGLLGEAREAILEVLKRSPFHAHAVELLDRVETALGMRQDPAEMGAPESEEEVLAALVSTPPGTPTIEAPLEAADESLEPASSISPEVASPAEQEADRHLELGYTYREMNMLPEAIAAFEVAAQVPSRAALALEMIGYSLQAQGDTVNAVGYFYRSLEQGATPDRAPRMKYEIGIACEEAGDLENAMAWYAAAYTEDPTQPHLRARIEHLGGNPDLIAPQGGNGTYENGGAAPSHGFDQAAAQRSAKKSKISYL